MVSLISSLGWGWLGTATTANQSFTGVTPVSALARLVSIIAGLFSVHVSIMGAHNVFAVLGLVLAGLISILRLLPRSPERGVRSAASGWPCWPWLSSTRSCGPGT